MGHAHVAPRERDGRHLAAPLEEPDRFLFSHLATRLADRDDSPGFAKELETRFAGAAAVTTWREETQDLIEIQRIRQTAMDLLALAIMAIAATGIANTVLMAAHERVREIGTLRAMGLGRRGVVGLFVLEGLVMGGVGGLLGALLGGGYNHKAIFNTMSMSVLERTGEIGVMRAMGMSRPRALGLFLVESIFIGLLGSALGVALGSAGAWYLQTYGVNLGEDVVAKMGSSFPMKATVYADLSLATVATAVALGIVASVLGALLPALRASSIQPVLAMRARR